jgi:hypothetical protein
LANAVAEVAESGALEEGKTVDDLTSDINNFFNAVAGTG